MFSDSLFAQFAGTRTCAFLDSDFYAKLDEAYGGLLSQFTTVSSDVSMGEDMGGEDEGDNRVFTADVQEPESPPRHESFQGDLEEPWVLWIWKPLVSPVMRS